MTDDERRECSDPPCAQNWCDKHAKMPGYGLPEDHERRERYAAAMGPCNTLREHADAAIAVADEEIRGLAQELVEMGADLSARRREGDRLVELNRGLHSDLQESADALEKSAQLLEDALNENERLRAELEDMARGAELKDWADAASAVARLDAESTISRVRAVLDTADVSDRETGFFQDVRDALDGDSDASA